MIKRILLYTITLIQISGYCIAEQKSYDIAAIVNNEVITQLDLQKKVDFIIHSTGIDVNSSEMLHSLKIKALQGLIDDILVRHAAKAMKLSISDEHMNHILNAVAARNQIKRNELKEYLSNKGIDMDILHEQLYHEALMEKIVDSQIAPNIQVTDIEIEENEHLIQGFKKHDKEVHLAEIVFFFKNDSDKKNKVDLAKHLKSEILKDKTNFNKISKEFSESISSSKGGDIGWVKLSHLNDILAQAVMKLQKEDISKIIIGDNAVHILKLLDIREPENKKISTQIETMIYNRKLGLAIESYLISLRQNGFVEIKDIGF